MNAGRTHRTSKTNSRSLHHHHPRVSLELFLCKTTDRMGTMRLWISRQPRRPHLRDVHSQYGLYDTTNTTSDLRCIRNLYDPCSYPLWNLPEKIWNTKAERSTLKK